MLQLWTQSAIRAAAPVVDTAGFVTGHPADPSLIGTAGTPVILGSSRMVPVSVYPYQGSARLVYVDPYAARAARLEIPRGNLVTDAFQRSLIDRFALHTQGDRQRDPAVLTAARYAQSEGNLGDGRGGIHVDSGVFVKGTGRTSLVRPDKSNHTHNNGSMGEHVGVFETVWGRVNRNLLGDAGPLTIAIIGLEEIVRDDETVPEEPAAILLRGGQGIRPAHLISRRVYDEVVQILRRFVKALQPGAVEGQVDKGLNIQPADDAYADDSTLSLEQFIRAAYAANLLLYHAGPDGELVPDFQETFRNMLDHSALISARQYRWRLMHGGPSPGNLLIDGSMLDLETMSAQPRHADYYAVSHTLPFGWHEFRFRPYSFWMMWQTLRGLLSLEEVEAYHFSDFDFEAYYRDRFMHSLGPEFLSAMGLKSELAERITDSESELVTEFTNTLYELANLTNPGERPRAAGFDGKLLEDDNVIAERAVVDVMNMLSALPAAYFADPKLSLTDLIMSALNPIYRGDAAEQQAEVRRLAERIAELYPRIMAVVFDHVDGFYDGGAEMQQAVASKAHFENRPMPDLYLWRLRGDLFKILEDPEQVEAVLRDRETLTRFIHSRVARSLRNTERLTRDGDVYVGNDGSVSVGVMTYDGVSQGIQANLNGGRSLFVRVSLQEVANGSTTFGIPGVPSQSFYPRALEGVTLNFRLNADDSQEQQVTGRFVKELESPDFSLTQ